ncbi:MAG: peptidase [Bryobacterales bacterium]|nr:peptidase [Bryobacterales bacterium]
MTRALLVLCLLTIPACLFAQHTLNVPPGAQWSPNFDADAATKAYLATVPAAAHAKSDAYFEGGYWLILWDFLVTAAICILLLETRWSARMRDFAERLTRVRALQIFIYWIEYSFITYVLGFPLTVYEAFAREKKYGLMNQTFGGWMGDQAKAFLVSLILGGVAVVVLFAVVRRLPRTWPVWGGVVAVVFLAFGAVIGPVFIAPLFNKYTVLNDVRITDPVLRLARANGIPATNVYEVDASKQSKRVSANVSGFLGTERITLNDNLLNRSSPQAVLAVMGHEMGHYVLNHVYKLVFFFGVVYVVAFLLLRWSLSWALGRWGARWGIRDLTDPAVLPLVVLILSIFGFVFTPIQNSFIRTQEQEADMFGLNASRQPDGFAEAALMLAEYRKLEPGPIEEALFFDHPSGRTRIYSAMRWRKENPPPQP